DAARALIRGLHAGAARAAQPGALIALRVAEVRARLAQAHHLLRCRAGAGTRAVTRGLAETHGALIGERARGAPFHRALERGVAGRLHLVTDVIVEAGGVHDAIDARQRLLRVIGDAARGDGLLHVRGANARGRIGLALIDQVRREVVTALLTRALRVRVL